MPESVNFVKHRRKLLTKRQQQDQHIFKYVAMGLGVIFVMFVLAVAARLYLAYSLSQVLAKQGQFKQLVITQESNERAYVVFASKIKTLVDLFAKRRDKQEAISYFSSAFGNNVLISNISYEEDGSILSLGLESDDVFVLEEVFNNLNSQTVKDQFQQLTLSELKRSADGKYKVTVTVVLRSASPIAEEVSPK